MEYFYITFLILSFNAVQASIYSNLKDNVFALWRRSSNDRVEPNLPQPDPGSMRRFHHIKKNDARDARSTQNEANILETVRNDEEDLSVGRDIPSLKLTESLNNKIGGEYLPRNLVSNELQRKPRSFRRKKYNTEELGESTSLEMRNWMDEWDDHWIQKKFEALNSTKKRGDVVNMVAARPWGVSCGDPNQHDMPSGSCTLAAECDAEFRIYRGDYFCGRTEYVCCGLLLTTYDMYQGLDISFDDSSFSTDSNERDNREGSKESNRRKRRLENDKRKKERDRRKRKMRNSIDKIVKEIRKILNRAWRNGTAQRKRKTKELKKFIDLLKDQYRKDRMSVVNVHEYEMVKIDKNLQKKLDQINDVNHAFMTNETFRDIVINGTINKDNLRTLLRSFPQLKQLLTITRSLVGKRIDKKTTNKKSKSQRRTEKKSKHREKNVKKAQARSGRRSMSDVLIRETDEEPTMIEYDLEYGQLYF